MKKIKKLNKITKMLLLFLFILTLFRVYLAIKTPLFIQADAGYDDFLFIKYTLSLLKFNWLGPFSVMILAKGCSFSIFLAVNYILGIPYSFALISTYIFSIMTFIFAIKKLINNRLFLSGLYIFLLFSPVMFHTENIQKVYRGGVIVAFSLLIIATIIGIYTRYKNLKKLTLWSILSALSLSFFWFLKEDSIWIIPFVLGGITVTIVNIIREKETKKNKSKKIFIVLIPLLFLTISNFLYSSINYIKYGEFTVTDRSGTYFKKVLGDILLIEDKKDIDNIWITKEMLYKAIDASPTLNSIRNEFDNMYKKDSFAVLSNGEIEGYMIFWTIKDSISKAGLYDQGGKKVNKFYRKIDKELKNAFNKNKLQKSKDIYLTSVAKGLSNKDIEYFKNRTGESINMLVTYNQHDLGVYTATGSNSDIALMQHLTNSQIVWKESTNIEPFKIIVNLSNKIVLIYQKTGWIFFYLGIIGNGILILKSIVELVKKKHNNIPMLLIVLGMMVTIIILLFIVLYFCRFLSIRKVYDYTCGIIPIIQILEIIGIYYLLNQINIILKSNKTLKKNHYNI